MSLLDKANRFKLLYGPYRTPRLKRGAIIEDEIRGEVTIVGLTDARIPWPIGKRSRAKLFVVFGALARAIRRESVQAVCYWFGVSRPWVQACRRALGVPMHNEGTLRLRVKYADEPAFQRAGRKGLKQARRPDALAKNAAARRGQRRQPCVGQKIAAALRGRPKSAEHCEAMSLAKKRSCFMPAWVVHPWTEQENAIVRALPVKEAAQRIGRTVKAVYHRRNLLGLPNTIRGRSRRSKP
jgi:hypothetical protein